MVKRSPNHLLYQEEMIVEGDYSEAQINEFLTKVSMQSLASVDAIYLICNPKDRAMPRHICIKSKDRLDGWNYNWIPIATDDSPYARMLKEIEDKEKFVQQYYLTNKKKFADVRTLQGQMQMEDATDVYGGSFVLQSKTHRREHIIRYLVRAFLVLAKAINKGNFNVNTVLTVSLKIDSNWKVYCNRVKLDMSDSIYFVDVLQNIQRIFKRSHCMYYGLKFKSHVASYLSQLQEFQNTKRFDSPLRITTEQIDEILRELKPIFRTSQSRAELSVVSQTSESYKFPLFMFLFNLFKFFY